MMTGFEPPRWSAEDGPAHGRRWFILFQCYAATLDITLLAGVRLVGHTLLGLPETDDKDWLAVKLRSIALLCVQDYSFVFEALVSHASLKSGLEFVFRTLEGPVQAAEKAAREKIQRCMDQVLETPSCLKEQWATMSEARPLAGTKDFADVEYTGFLACVLSRVKPDIETNDETNEEVIELILSPRSNSFTKKQGRRDGKAKAPSRPGPAHVPILHPIFDGEPADDLSRRERKERGRQRSEARGLGREQQAAARENRERRKKPAPSLNRRRRDESSSDNTESTDESDTSDRRLERDQRMITAATKATLLQSSRRRRGRRDDEEHDDEESFENNNNRERQQQRGPGSNQTPQQQRARPPVQCFTCAGMFDHLAHSEHVEHCRDAFGAIGERCRICKGTSKPGSYYFGFHRTDMHTNYITIRGNMANRKNFPANFLQVNNTMSSSLVDS